MGRQHFRDSHFQFMALAVIIATTLLGSHLAVSGQTYDYINYVTFEDEVNSAYLRISDVGTVVYVRESPEGDSLVTIDRDGITTTIADTSGPLSDIRGGSINSNGDIAFQATFDVGGGAVFVEKNGSTTMIAETGSSFGIPYINDQEQVVYRIRDGDFEGVYITDDLGKTTTTIVDTSGEFSQVFPIDINNSGVVSFGAVHKSGEYFLATGDGTTTTMIADTSGAFDQIASGNLNDNGVVAFSARIDGIWSVYKSDGATQTLIVEPGDEFEAVGAGAINNEGIVMFFGVRPGDDPPWSKFVGPDPVNDAAVLIGMPLFGSNLRAQSSWIDVLNNNSEIVCPYALHNDQRGILVATPNGTTVDSFTVTFGNEAGGDIFDLEESDDSYLRVRSSFGFLSSEPNLIKVRVDAHTTTANPTAFHTTIESKANNPQGTATIKARNFDTNTLETIDSYTLLTTDETRVIGNIPADPYIRDNDGHIELEIKHVIVATFSLSGFISSFDRVLISTEAQ